MLIPMRLLTLYDKMRYDKEKLHRFNEDKIDYVSGVKLEAELIVRTAQFEQRSLHFNVSSLLQGTLRALFGQCDKLV